MYVCMYVCAWGWAPYNNKSFGPHEMHINWPREAMAELIVARDGVNLISGGQKFNLSHQTFICT